MALKYEELPQHELMVYNILKVYSEGTPEEVDEGFRWYGEAFQMCWNIAQDSGFTVPQVVGIMAVLSPAMVWDMNKFAPARAVNLFLEGVPCTEWEGFTTYPHNLVKCERILKDNDLTAVNGPKVQSFYSNIMGVNDVVTVDRWAVRIAVGNPHLGNDKITFGKKVYNAISQAYAESAEFVGVMPCEMQAITWTIFRNRWAGANVIRNRKELKGDWQPTTSQEGAYDKQSDHEVQRCKPVQADKVPQEV